MALPRVFLGPAFVALGLIFLSLALRESLKHRGMATPARKAWLRVGVIFTVVGLFLSVFYSYSR